MSLYMLHMAMKPKAGKLSESLLDLPFVPVNMPGSHELLCVALAAPAERPPGRAPRRGGVKPPSFSPALPLSHI